MMTHRLVSLAVLLLLMIGLAVVIIVSQGRVEATSVAAGIGGVAISAFLERRRR